MEELQLEIDELMRLMPDDFHLQPLRNQVESYKNALQKALHITWKQQEIIIQQNKVNEALEGVLKLLEEATTARAAAETRAQTAEEAVTMANQGKEAAERRAETAEQSLANAIQVLKKAEQAQAAEKAAMTTKATKTKKEVAQMRARTANQAATAATRAKNAAERRAKTAEEIAARAVREKEEADRSAHAAHQTATMANQELEAAQLRAETAERAITQEREDAERRIETAEQRASRAKEAAERRIETAEQRAAKAIEARDAAERRARTAEQATRAASHAQAVAEGKARFALQASTTTNNAMKYAERNAENAEKRTAQAVQEMEALERENRALDDRNASLRRRLNKVFILNRTLRRSMQQSQSTILRENSKADSAFNEKIAEHEKTIKELEEKAQQAEQDYSNNYSILTRNALTVQEKLSEARETIMVYRFALRLSNRARYTLRTEVQQSEAKLRGFHVTTAEYVSQLQKENKTLHEEKSTAQNEATNQKEVFTKLQRHYDNLSNAYEILKNANSNPIEEMALEDMEPLAEGIAAGNCSSQTKARARKAKLSCKKVAKKQPRYPPTPPEEIASPPDQLAVDQLRTSLNSRIEAKTYKYAQDPDHTIKNLEAQMGLVRAGKGTPSALERWNAQKQAQRNYLHEAPTEFERRIQEQFPEYYILVGAVLLDSPCLRQREILDRMRKMFPDIEERFPKYIAAVNSMFNNGGPIFRSVIDCLPFYGTYEEKRPRALHINKKYMKLIRQEVIFFKETGVARKLRYDAITGVCSFRFSNL